MKFFSTLIAAFASAGLASAATITVQVGANSILSFNPPQVSANVGDTIAFQFHPKNHSVTQSTFANPCTQSGVSSGFFPVAANATEIPQWSFTLNNASAPLWFFCQQTGHCEQGMVFAVNPTATKSFAAFQAAANATNPNSAGSPPPAPSAGAGSGTAATGAIGSPSASVIASPTGASSGALSRSQLSSAAGLLTVVGLVAGLVL